MIRMCRVSNEEINEKLDEIFGYGEPATKRDVRNYIMSILFTTKGE